MALSLNEIKIRAQQFVLNWKDKAATAREDGGVAYGEEETGEEVGSTNMLQKTILDLEVQEALFF